MIQQLRVRNLRGISLGEIPTFGAVTIFCGPNGSGKSTLLHALLIASSSEPHRGLERVVDLRPAIGGGPRWLATRGALAPSAIDVVDDTNADYGLELKPESGNRPGEHTIRIYRVETTELESELAEASATDAAEWYDDAVRPKPRLLSSVRWSRDGVATVDVYSTLPTGQSVPVLVDPLEPFELHELYATASLAGERLAAKSVLRELLPDVDDVEILVDGGQAQLYAISAAAAIPVRLAGDGVTAVLRIALELTRPADSLVLLEEPETWQHPRAMRQTAGLIVAAARRGVQVVLATHSIEFIDFLVEAARTEPGLLHGYRLALHDNVLRCTGYTGEEIREARVDFASDLR